MIHCGLPFGKRLTVVKDRPNYHALGYTSQEEINTGDAGLNSSACKAFTLTYEDNIGVDERC